ncbi:MAG: polyribonucleotide nucleotidyltransferase [Vulcanimicrobiota bacterium]
MKTETKEKPRLTVEGNKIIVEREIAGKTLRMETGELARQANGAVLVQYGDTQILSTATMSSPREGMDFFPLLVDFEEKMYAAGKIPGGFFKREGRPSEKSILSSRLTDRTLRPLFPDNMRNDVQVVCVVLSADMENDSDIIGMNGASAALSISGIPFNGPIAGVRMSYINEELVVNPTQQEQQNSKMNLVVAGTRTDIMMVEANTEEVDEDLLLEAFKIAHKVINEIIDVIEALAEKTNKPQLEVTLATPDEDLEKFVKENFTSQVAKAMRIIEKQERQEAFDQINEEKALEILEKLDDPQKEKLTELLEDSKNKDFGKILKSIQEEELRKMVVDENLRPDGRKNDEIRPLDCQVGLLTRTHGSGLFTRGQTQVLTSVTLGPMSEGQEIDDLTIIEQKRYMHQYNFPAFSVGETRPMRGPGRREIGHGNLAERALLPMIPDEDEFPYALRVVSEVLESNGSSSMASVCASTLALMDAGVPIRKPVAGIAMGLILKDSNHTILTDIQGLEDHLGEMDFKVAGTREGVTALQMDIKVQGISIEIMKNALEQAKDARLFILDTMAKTLAEPRPELSPYAPRIFTMVIDPDKIRDVIGPGGKMINKIIDETGVKIDIENDGTIYIASQNLEMAEKAQGIIQMLVSEPEVGEVYQGKVVRTTDFGVFVEIKPGKDGLIRNPNRNVSLSDYVDVGDIVTVEINEIDNIGRINLNSPEVMSKVPESKTRGGGGGGGYRGGKRSTYGHKPRTRK